MIVYRPSVGNEKTKVGINSNGEWSGESLGGSIIIKRKTSTSPQVHIDAILDSTSTWFFKPITDNDFIVGSTSYRCFYVGAEESDNVSEYIGAVSLTYPITGSSLVIPNVSIEVYNEGKFNIFTSKNTITLDDEKDTTTLLSSATWSSGLTINDTVAPGEYYKIWIKIEIIKDITLIDEDDWYVDFNINDLNIIIPKYKGRLNIDKVYYDDISEKKDTLLKPFLPFNYDYVQQEKILKIININDMPCIFYIDDNGYINQLIVKKEENINENKYVNVKYTCFSQITSSNNFLNTSLTEPSTFNPTTREITPSDDALSTCITASSQISDYNMKLYKILGTNKNENYIYFFFNEYAINNDQEYEVKYGHNTYIWKTSAYYYDFSYINDTFFENISGGSTNTYDIDIQTLDPSFEKTNYFIRDINLFDDLFVGIGFDVKDCCKIDELNTYSSRIYLSYIWEKDISKRI